VRPRYGQAVTLVPTASGTCGGEISPARIASEPRRHDTGPKWVMRAGRRRRGGVLRAGGRRAVATSRPAAEMSGPMHGRRTPDLRQFGRDAVHAVRFPETKMVPRQTWVLPAGTFGLPPVSCVITMSFAGAAWRSSNVNTVCVPSLLICTSGPTISPPAARLLTSAKERFAGAVPCIGMLVYPC
jgi:hypothetical protein